MLGKTSFHLIAFHLLENASVVLETFDCPKLEGRYTFE